MDITKKKLFIFDMDKTLTLSKQPMDLEMCEILSKLLEKRFICIISGGRYEIFRDVYLSNLKIKPQLLKKLFLFPTCGASFYKYEDENTVNVYSEEIPEEERKIIINSFYIMFKEIGFQIPKKVYGELIEDRKSQITFSAFGQKAPLEVKGSWDLDKSKRTPMIKIMQRLLPNYDTKYGGSSSIDITLKGINKGYGIKKMVEYLKFSKEEMIFFGDDLEENGNDYPVKLEGIDCIAVSNPEDTKNKLKTVISSLQNE